MHEHGSNNDSLLIPFTMASVSQVFKEQLLVLDCNVMPSVPELRCCVKNTHYCSHETHGPNLAQSPLLWALLPCHKHFVGALVGASTSGPTLPIGLDLVYQVSGQIVEAQTMIFRLRRQF